MPIYEFRCQRCKEHFEQLTSINYDPASITCPVCKETNPQRLVSTFGFKGSKPGSLSSKSCSSCSSTNCSSC